MIRRFDDYVGHGADDDDDDDHDDYDEFADYDNAAEWLRRLLPLSNMLSRRSQTPPTSNHHPTTTTNDHAPTHTHTRAPTLARRYYEGMVLHCVLRFPPNYPHTSPTLSLQTPIRHANVFGSWVCLDMLATQWWPSHRRNDKAFGWTRYVCCAWACACVRVCVFCVLWLCQPASPCLGVPAGG
jgi:hypothetical protein